METRANISLSKTNKPRTVKLERVVCFAVISASVSISGVMPPISASAHVIKPAYVQMLSQTSVDYTPPQTSLEAAQRLNAIGLFNGVGSNPDGTRDFALESGLTRYEAAVLLVRLIGKESEARSGTPTHPSTYTEMVVFQLPLFY